MDKGEESIEALKMVLNDFHKNYKKRLELLNKPLFIEELVKTGVIKKVGDAYYCKNVNKLPEHVKEKCRIISDSISDETRIEFYSKERINKLKELAKKGKRYTAT
jgi:hypothetical protein